MCLFNFSARNANVESRTKKGCTPFFLACKDGHKDIAIMLSKHGADTEVNCSAFVTVPVVTYLYSAPVVAPSLNLIHC